MLHAASMPTEAAFAVPPAPVDSIALPIIPAPVSLQRLKGTFLLDESCAFQYDRSNADISALIPVFWGSVGNITGFDIPSNPETRSNKAIYIRIKSDKTLGTEGYALRITPKYILLSAPGSRGLFYGMQSLLQLIETSPGNQLPCLEIADYPRFGWRGMHLDVSRHFFPKSFIKEYIDLLSRYKMNVFHWHLCDDQGWRIEIKRYPLLTSVGAWRPDRPGKSWQEREPPSASEPALYGGFYTQDDVREVVRYAAERGITVLPEIEMPGHSAAALAAYPQYSCQGLPVMVQTGGNYNYAPTFCAGNDSTYLFLQGILDEVIQLFPSPYIHVGGDEVDKHWWHNCQRCQHRMTSEGLKDENELQSYFIRRIERYLSDKGRRLIGWDEILEGGLAPDATVMSWRGEAGGIAATRQKHFAVMSPGSHCYFDHYQGDPSSEPLAISGYTTLKKVYSYEPVPAELTPAEAAFILGAQANVWTEWIETGSHAEYMVLPRMLALSEVVWSPASRRHWPDFRRRLESHFRWFERQGLHYSKGTFRVEIKPQLDTLNHVLSAVLETEAEGVTLRYSLDGSEPGNLSPVYTAPIVIDRSMTIKAIATGPDVPPARANARRFEIHQASGDPVTYAHPYSSQYAADGPNSLTDGIRGDRNFGASWHGFLGSDLVATLDLGAITTVDSVILSCLQRYESWIFLPVKVTFFTSLNGVDFIEAGTSENTLPPTEKGYIFREFGEDLKGASARYIRVAAQNPGVCPKGHPGEGKPAWLFADEIIVK